MYIHMIATQRDFITLATNTCYISTKERKLHVHEYCYSAISTVAQA